MTSDRRTSAQKRLKASPGGGALSLTGVVGTGVDPVTYRFSGGRSTN